MTKRELVLITLTVCVTFVAARVFSPDPPEPPPVIPRIVTVHDTVETLPKWFADSVKRWKRVIHTTDTVNIYVSNTIVDTEYVPVNSPPEERPKLWPVLEYRGGARFGDSAVVSTFDLRSGSLGLSKVHVAGILTAIAADTGSMPKLTFVPFPPKAGVSLWTKLKYIGLGVAGCSMYATLVP